MKEDLISHPDCLIAECDCDIFSKVLGGNLQKIINFSIDLDFLSSIMMFKNFSYQKICQFGKFLKEEKFTDGQKIIIQGDYSSKFYVIKSGKVDVFVNNIYTRSLNIREYFGERSLLFSEPRSATVQANGDVILLTIDKDEFKTIIEESQEKYLINSFHLRDTNVEIIDLDWTDKLGNGNYGEVIQVLHRKTNYSYALKIISKIKIDKDELHNYLDLEKKILLQTDCPFIVKLVKTLKDDKNIYFLMELIKGKELFDVIREIGILNKFQSQFYGGSILLAINYLHQRNFIHRDIKPENIMVDSLGFIKLIDFGTAKKIIERTSTIIGTPHYMAPEIILGQGYSFEIDVWSTAICIYEFYCGKVPFGESADDPMQVYYAIVNSELEFPVVIFDKEFIKLMKAMLNKNPISRLYKIEFIKRNAWFKFFDWEKLINLSLEAPFIPKIKKNFQVEGTLLDFLQNKIDLDDKKNIIIDKIKSEEYQNWHSNF